MSGPLQLHLPEALQLMQLQLQSNLPQLGCYGCTMHNAHHIYFLLNLSD